MKLQLSQQQSLKITMSQGLSQAISLLQYSSIEILNFLQEQAESNPLIDIDKQERMHNSFLSKIKHADALDFVASKNETLSEYLLGQLIILNLSYLERRIVTYIIQSLDENGYFADNIQEIAYRFHTTDNVVEDALELVQHLEPYGVGARNLHECLYIQLERRQLLSPLVEKILMHHFEEYAYKKWNKITSELQVNKEKLQDIHNLILTLNPRPGLKYNIKDQAVLIPDYIIKHHKNELELLSNQASLQVKMNKSYKDALSNKLNPEMYSYLNEKYKEFQWIRKGLETRIMTLNKIMMCLLECQKDFFLIGPEYLKPLCMKDIASKINVHESTVSRAVKNKYVQTPFGTFHLRSLFTNRAQTFSYDDVSSTRIKLLIKQIIEEENKNKPFSDQQVLSELQKKHGVEVSRRTVAKYRHQLNILSSTQRKRFDVS